MRLRATLTIRNAAMILARANLGINQAELADRAGCTLNAVAALERLDYSRKVYRDAAVPIACALALNTDEVMPAGAEMAITSTARAETDVSPSGLIAMSDRLQSRLILPSPDEVLERVNTRAMVVAAMEKLTHREREIIKLRYGIGDGYTYTLEEVGWRFNVNRERTRQIEAGALRKMQHPANVTRIWKAAVV